MDPHSCGIPTQLGDFLCFNVRLAFGAGSYKSSCILEKDGKLIYEESSNDLDHLTNSVALIKIPTHGYNIITAGVYPYSSACPAGNASAKIYLARSNVVTTAAPFHITGGFPSFYSPLCWPGPSIASSCLPHGSPLNLELPAVAGPPSIYSIPRRGIWMIHRISFIYTTHAEAGNRFVYVYIFDRDGFSLYRISCVTAMTAGQTRFFYFDSSVIDEVLTDDAFHLPMAPLYLNKNDDINIGAVGAKAGDTITNATIQLKLWAGY